MASDEPVTIPALKQMKSEGKKSAGFVLWDYQTALRHGVFCELGKGSVDFRTLLRALEGSGYDGWIVVEQDVLPGMGAPADSAGRNRMFLREVGI